MKSRRRIAHPKAWTTPIFKVYYSRDLRPAKWRLTINLRCKRLELPMSVLGQKRTLRGVGPMSALPPKADIGTQSWNVRFVPKADNRLLWLYVDLLLNNNR
jgi:hypothetical protein